MMLHPSQWDPMLMDKQKLRSIFDAVAAKVGPNEAQTYIETMNSKFLTEENSCQAAKLCWRMAESFAIIVSYNLMASLKQDSNESEDILKAYEDNRSFSDAHYDEQMKTEKSLSEDDGKHNAFVALHKAVSREFYTQMIAHMPG